MLGTTRQSDDFENIEVNEKSTAPTKVLSTYGGVDAGTKNYFFHILFAASALLLIVSLPLAFVYVPALSPISDYKIDKGDKCWVSSSTTCENNLKAYIYFWNITNPDAVIAGTEPPALEEVGPYVMSDVVNKRQNITFSDYDREVSFVSTLYGAMDTDNFCENCTVGDQIVSFNLAYIGMVESYGSEKNILAMALPTTLSTLVAGIVALFSGIASDPTLGPNFPTLVAALQSGPAAMESLAIEQLFFATPLGGNSVTQLSAVGVPSAYLTGFPDVPEFVIAVNTIPGITGVTVSSLAIPTATSVAMYNSIIGDATGMTAAQTLAAPPGDIATAYSIPTTSALIWQAYLDYVMVSYGANAFRTSLGPFLGPTSGGMLVKRSVHEWIFGYTDPVVSPTYPTSDPRRFIRSVTKIRDVSTIGIDHVPWTVTDKSTWAYVYGSTPYRIATGVYSSEEATDILQRTDGTGSITYPHSGHIEKVIGKDIVTGQYAAIKNLGAETDVTAWGDFGMGLDLKRSLTLRRRAGRSVEKNDKVSVETYGVAYEDFLPCPINRTSCGRNTEYHGSFNVSGFTLIPTVYTLPHGHRANPRVFVGDGDISSSDWPFAPDATKHDIEFSIYERTGNTVGMRVPIQPNYKIQPTDVFYRTLWTSASGGAVHLPIAWTSLEYDMTEDFYTSIKDTITHIELLVATWTYICPSICAMGLLLSGVKLYVRRVLNHRLLDENQYMKDCTRDDSRAIESFSEKHVVQDLKAKDGILGSRHSRSSVSAAAGDVVVNIPSNAR